MKLPVFSRAYILLLSVFLINACSLEDATEPGSAAASGAPSGLSTPAPTPDDTQAPTVPTGLNATTTSTRVTLSWQAASDDTGVSGYEVFRNGVSRGTVTIFQYTDNNVVAGQNYNYRVRAFDAAGNQSALSSTLNVVVPMVAPPADTTEPSIPTGLSSTQTSSQVNLSWNASSDNVGVTGYEIFRDGVSRGAVATTQYTDTSVVAGQGYSYQVRAFDAAGNNSTRSNALNVTVPNVTPPPDTAAPTVPTGLNANATSTQVALNWAASSDDTGVTGYEVFRDGTSQGTVASNQYTDTSVVSGQSYSYRVRAFDAAGNQSAQSAALAVAVPATTPPDTTAPTVPAGLSANASSAMVSLSWSAASDNVAVTGYEVFRDGTSLSSVATNQFNDSSITAGQTYSYEVLAYDLAGNTSAKSTALSVSVPQAPVSGGPIILYSDIVSGPASGGEGNNGAYLSIFGINFGNSSTLGSTTKLYINDVEVSRYMLIKNAMSQTMPNVKTLQQITVQVGALGGATPGVNLPIKLVVNGVASNTDKMFMIQPGDIYYVDNVSGVEVGVKNDPAQPFRYVQSKSGILGVINDFAGPGDIVVMRDTGTAWTDLVGGAGQERFIRFNGITGSQPTGSPGNGPLTIMGYPGENVVIQCQDDTRCGIHGVDGYSSSALAASSDWITIANLRIRGGGPQVKDGPINLQHRSDNWRIVNNELFDWDGNAIEGRVINGKSYQEARAGGITGDGVNVKILGNHIHDINGGTKNHGIYVDGGAQNWEIAYNHIERSYGGNIIQTFDSGGYGNMKNIDVHHNRLHDGSRYGVNYSDATASGKIYDNVIYNIAAAGVRFSTASGTAISVTHNTLYNTCGKTSVSDNDPSSPPPASKIPNNASAIANDWSGQGIKIQNNILHSNTNCSSYIGNTGNYSTMVIDNNLYTGLSATPNSRDASAVTGNPSFTNVATADFRLGASSAAVDNAAVFSDFTLVTDFLINPRNSGAGADIGAIELGQ